MKVSLALLADFANVTADGKLNILGIFQAVIPPQFPYVHGQMHLILSFEADRLEIGKKKKLEISFRDADGKSFFTISGDMEIPSPSLQIPGPITMNHILAMNGMRFERPGSYEFVVLIDGEPKEQVVLRALEQPKPESKG